MVNGVTLNFQTPGGSRTDSSRITTPTDGTWHHIAAVIDRGRAKTMTYYIDGKQAEAPKSIAAHHGTIDSSDFLIGASNKSDGTKFLAVDDAWIDEFSVSRRALSAEEIAASANTYLMDLELERIDRPIDLMTAGERYTPDAIETMKAPLAKAREDMKAEGADRQAIYDALLQAIYDALLKEYDTFMEGTPAKLSFHVVSDLHTSSEASLNTFSKALADMNTINPEAKAILLAGDLTQSGTPEQMTSFYDRLEAGLSEKTEGVLVAMGNHEMRGPTSSQWEDSPGGVNAHFPIISASYLENNARYMGENDDKLYYDQWIDGYHFIVLNSENSPKDMAWLSQEQHDWLDEKLSEDESLSRPAFIMIHQALNYTHSGSMNYNGFGDQDEAMKAILAKHPETILITGHIHNPFGTAEIMNSVWGTLVDVPVFTGKGLGYEVYVYDTEVVFRARNHNTKEWMPDYDVIVELDTLPSLVARTKALNEKDYTTDSWNKAYPALQEYQSQAEEIQARTYGNFGAAARQAINVLQKKYLAAFAELEEAVPADRSKLQASVDTAAALQTAGGLEGLEENIVAEFNAALTEANVLLKDESATQEQIDASKVRVDHVLDLAALKDDLSALNALIAKAEAIDSDKYTEASVSALTTPVSQAKALKADLSRLNQENIIAASTSLQTAIDGLKVKVDRSALQTAVNTAEAKQEAGDLNGLPQATVSEFEAALSEAKALLVNENAAQEQVNTSKSRLDCALELVALKGDQLHWIR